MSALTALWFVGCGEGSVSNQTGGTGGSVTAAGGATSATGGSTTVATGGNSATGGATSVATGGTIGGKGGTSAGGIPSGGSIATGGTPATGGSVATGGTSSGGSPTAGGVLATGGRSATGGSPVTGGNSTPGGALATGGTPASGGSTGTGGSACIAAATGGPRAMNAGQACIQCHGPGGDRPTITLGGTLFAGTGNTAVAGATVVITQGNGQILKLVTGNTGNFYTSQAIAYPAKVEVSKCPDTARMLATITNGDCNSCHNSGMRIRLP